MVEIVDRLGDKWYIEIRVFTTYKEERDNIYVRDKGIEIEFGWVIVILNNLYW